MTARFGSPAPRGYRPWAASVAGNLTVRLLGLVAGVVLARSIGPVGRGLITGAILWPMLILGVGTVVAVRCVAYFGAKYGAPGFRACFLLAVLGALPLLLLTWAVNWFILGAAGKHNYLASNIYAFGVPLAVMSALFAGVLLVDGRVGGYWTNEAITAGATAIGVLGLAFTHSLSPTTYAVAAVVAVSVALIVTGGMQKSIRTFFPVDTKVVGLVTRYAAAMVVTQVPQQLNLRVDQMVVAVSSPPGFLGNYAVAFGWSSVLAMIGSGFSAVILADSAHLDLTQAADVEIAASRLRRASLVVFGGGLATCVTAPIAIRLLYGSPFSAAVAPAMILSLASIPLYVGLLVHEFSRGAGLPITGWLPETAGVVVSLLALKILYLHFHLGMIGAASSSLISYTVVLLLLLHQLRQGVPLLRWRACVPTLADGSAVWETGREMLLRRGGSRLTGASPTG